MNFNSLFDMASKSPFKGPLTVAQCAAAVPGGAVSGDSCEFGSTKYFLLCGLGGIISCGKFDFGVFFFRRNEENISFWAC